MTTLWLRTLGIGEWSVLTMKRDTNLYWPCSTGRLKGWRSDGSESTNGRGR